MTSFQRYSCPAAGVVEAAPPSLGALRVGVGARGGLFLPVAGEAFWIGIHVARGSPSLDVAVLAALEDGCAVDTFSGIRPGRGRLPTRATVPPMLVLPGIRRPDGTSWWALTSAPPPDAGPACQGLVLAMWRRNRCVALARIRLVDFAEFTARTGLPPPPPLDPDAGYGGWRLP